MNYKISNNFDLLPDPPRPACCRATASNFSKIRASAASIKYFVTILFVNGHKAEVVQVLLLYHWDSASGYTGS